ncbi:MAG: thioredoxin family protein [Euryarchaeota archaeon]|nr:thioredoxin family protein [Euryarchaeota archaeon]
MRRLLLGTGVALAGIVALLLISEQPPREDGVWIWNNLPEALEEAREQRKPVLINFWTPSCYWCVKMDEVMQEPEVRAAMDEYVLLRVDTSRRSSGELLRRYGIYGTPAFVVLSPEGEVLATATGYMPRQEFLRFLRESLP